MTAKAALEIKHFAEEKENLVSSLVKVFFKLIFFVAFRGFRTTGPCS